MTEVSIEQMNEVIALFEGRKRAHVNQKGKTHIFWSDPTGTNPLYCEDLYYHVSWDELMPVWKKAGAILFDIRGDLSDEKYLEAHRITKAFMDACQKVDIDRAHAAVYNAVQFIQWYNQTLKQQQ